MQHGFVVSCIFGHCDSIFSKDEDLMVFDGIGGLE